MNRDLLMDQLSVHEGLMMKPYRDSVGKLTIGVGRNLEDRGITAAEARYLLENDIEAVEKDLDANLPGWRAWSEMRQRAIADMAFNLGWPKLSQFKRMLLAMEAGDWAMAADEALDSKWAKQVGARADTIARMLREG